jgi:hypothetical protein
MPMFDCATGEQREYTEEEQAAIDALPGSVDLIEAERDRRLAFGFDYDFGGERGVHRIGTTEKDLKGWDEVTQAATIAMLLANPTFEIGIDTDTGPAVVTAAEWLAVMIAAGQFRQPIWLASFALAAMDPIPGDLADDAYWTGS